MTELFNITPRQELEGMYSDMYKDAYGIRPRGINLSAYSDDEIHAKLDGLSELISEQIDEEKAYNAKQLINFNAKVDEVIKMGAGNRKTALRWMLEDYNAYDLAYGAEYIFFKLGLDDKELADEINPIIGEILETKAGEKVA